MPLIGKLGQGRLYDLLESTMQRGEDALLEFQSPTQAATLHIQGGQLQQVAHEHHNTANVLADINNWDDGLFLVYDGSEKQTSQSAPLWFLVQDPQQLAQLRESLQPLGLPIWSVCYPYELPDLIAQFNPSVLVTTSNNLTTLPPTVFAGEANKPHDKRLKLLCLGPPPPQNPTPLTLEALPWPSPASALQQTVLSMIPGSAESNPTPFHKVTPSLGDQNDPILELLATLTPDLPDDLCLHIHPHHQETLTTLDLAPNWRQWLLSLDRNVPLSHYFGSCPGNAHQAKVLLRYLLYLGVLTTHNPLYSLLSPSQETPPNPAQAESPLHISRIVTLGLRGQWKEDWIFSLQQLSQQMSMKVPRNTSVHIPYLPKSELARIPLPNESLLLFYGLLNVEKLEPLLNKIGGSVDAFLFFVDASHEAEVLYAQELRQQLLARHMVPHVVMLTQLGVAPSGSELERFRLHPNERMVPISKLDESATNRVLYQLLQQFPQHRHIIPPPTSGN
ncbi:MAG: hypothetical protein EP343_32375 [Deltaproteobacteria bacterium]|nr:MAG: hypothetical protein EP343_32375 [Deltaproteobacteria bacterium]